MQPDPFRQLEGRRLLCVAVNPNLNQDHLIWYGPGVLWGALAPHNDLLYLLCGAPHNSEVRKSEVRSVCEETPNQGEHHLHEL